MQSLVQNSVFLDSSMLKNKAEINHGHTITWDPSFVALFLVPNVVLVCATYQSFRQCLNDGLEHNVYQIFGRGLWGRQFSISKVNNTVLRASRDWALAYFIDYYTSSLWGWIFVLSHFCLTHEFYVFHLYSLLHLIFFVCTVNKETNFSYLQMTFTLIPTSM